MKPFRIKIAGLTAQVQPLFESTAAYCRNYFTDESPAFHIVVKDDDLTFEQLMLDAEAREEGLKLRKFTDPFLERTAIQRRIAEELLKHDTLLLHGSTIAVGGQAYLFTAACGTGKSTHVRLWRETFGDQAVMINDDKTFLRICENSVVAFGSPWSGKHGLDTNISGLLQGICVLNRGSENVIWRADPESVIELLHHQSFLSADPDLQQKTRKLVEILAQKVPLWEMECTKDRSAADISFAAMSKSK